METITKIVIAIVCVCIMVLVLAYFNHKFESYTETNGIPERNMNYNVVSLFDKFLSYHTPNKEIISQNVSNIPIYTINLGRHSRRRDKIKKQETTLGFKINFVEAIDVRDIKVQGSNSTNEPYKINYINNHTLNHDAELACTLSHIKTWLIVQDLPQDIVLITEDDINFSMIEYWDRTLMEIIQSAPPDWHTISIYANCDHPSGSEYNNFVRDKCWGSVAYLINKKGIKNALDQLYDTDNVINFDRFDILPASDMLLPSLINSWTTKNSYLFPLNVGNINSTIHKTHTDAHIDLQSKMINVFTKTPKIVNKWNEFLNMQKNINKSDYTGTSEYLQKYLPNIQDCKLSQILQEIDQKGTIILDENIKSNKYRSYEKCKVTIDHLEYLSDLIRNYTKGNKVVIPKVIHQVWIGPKEPPWNLLESVKRFTEWYPNWTYKLWREEDIKGLGMVNYDTYVKEEMYAGKSDVLR